MPSRPDYVLNQVQGGTRRCLSVGACSFHHGFGLDLPDGSTEAYAFRVHPSARPGDISWTRRVFGRDGTLWEVWHEVADATGRIIHSHRHR